ncbi:DUF2076 domain-containing protein [Shimwellia blattae]|uniref:Periplasmic ligand-binding sensor protein n=1 Tax=Shimwellia blattae (strain ATCC 29907 / DSM 4481 / JCM 1650 / NBRC 105725 / CDC 9005-74) TaxID=630626 RepID=I2BBV3_SHIBC|nr:DUF2076 domain-containing protein [Shimwellia blattae]AFJ48007.1 hypothetical protein EBL_c29370 [Shimwellia blattae DSM 4481 = NBRC 105725]GAB82003.1 hypothetical protein EB105725_18_01310 [Shimwellia blattae DSM 4481 = NBRC 105725]VDY65507.1 Uncharacterized protein conserved in bacteria (DUF2076) [Shimwellia blattae]VEC24796.1 Uncharacterized protein conserved in bacteria (DUF2076) [Shimwellia blattae]
MQSEEQRLIDDLFSRLQQAENQSGAREAGAEALIAEHIKQQPGAPYYMAQTILIQEAAIKQLSSRVEALEAEATRLRETARPASGGFLAGLFGGGQKAPTSEPGYQSGGSAPIPGTRPGSHYTGNNIPGNASYAAPAPQASRGGGFMAGALQTAAGVAGGVMLGNMLTSMFHQSAPEEIVNIIKEPEKDATTSQTSNVADTDTANNDNSDDSLLQNASWQDDNSGYGGDDFGGDDFGDDDSWI